MRSTCVANLLNEVGFFRYFEVRVRYYRKKSTLAISSPDEFLFTLIFAVLLPDMIRLLMFIDTTFFDFSSWRSSAILDFKS